MGYLPSQLSEDEFDEILRQAFKMGFEHLYLKQADDKTANTCHKY